jgi:hypothetical protein
MSKFLKVVDGDYKISVEPGREISLNTGIETGTVRISGDLVVEGNTVTVQSENLTVRDNVIVVNQGETGSGVTGSATAGAPNSSGISIDRGGFSDAYILFDENVTWLDPGDDENPDIDVTPRSGAFILRDDIGNLIGLKTNSIVTGGGNLFLISQGSGVLSVEGTVNYESNVTQDDHIPNKKYVDDAVLGFVGIRRIASGDEFIGSGITYVEALSKDVAIGNLESFVEFKIDNVSLAYFYDDRAEIDGVKIQDNQITTVSSGIDLVLKHTSNQSVLIDNNLAIKELPNPLLVPATPTDGVKIYASDQSIGGTGIYFVNKEQTRDELVSRSKSILYGIIF